MWKGAKRKMRVFLFISLLVLNVFNLLSVFNYLKINYLFVEKNVLRNTILTNVILLIISICIFMI